MSVTLRKRKNSDGTMALRLDIYQNGVRRIETLKELSLAKPSSLKDRADNKEKLALAEKIAVTRAAELQSSDYSIEFETGKKTVVTAWMQHYVDTYKKKDKRNMQGATNRFKTFLKDAKKDNLTFSHLTEILVEDFQEYLCETCKGEGSSSYFSRFKKMMKHAFRQKLIQRNPAADVRVKHITGKKKDVLTLDEIRILAATSTSNQEIRRAFLFSCVTGLRWIDIKEIKWNNIQFEEKLMKLRQGKTGVDMVLPLNDTALKLLGNPGKGAVTVFTLPSANGCNKTLKAWVKRAGIEKEITWHNARHSFGTNLIFNDVGVLTASQLLGHTSLKHTMRYVDTAKEMKRVATDKLNFEL